MFRRAAIVLSITLVMASLSAARAEDPDEDVVERFHAAVAHWPNPAHHAVPFSEPKRWFFPN
jgi:predicted NAD/FAD-dependent oxidoreductase